MTTENQDEKPFSRWYSRNKSDLNQSRKSRYETDPEYRQKCIEQSRKTREEKKKRVKESKKDHDTDVTMKLLNGEMVRAYRITEAAVMAGASPQTLRNLEDQGIIPASSFGGVHRYYTEHQVNLLKEYFDEVKQYPLHTQERKAASELKASELREGW